MRVKETPEEKQEKELIIASNNFFKEESRKLIWEINNSSNDQQLLNARAKLIALGARISLEINNHKQRITEIDNINFCS